MRKQVDSKIFVYHASQCDPKKCTGLRLGKWNFATIIKDMRRIPRASVVLNPVSRKAFSQQDREEIERQGIVALDCSWKQAEDIFRASTYGTQRALPYLLAANPINTYKPIKLSTAEAIAAALWIAGFERDAREIMSIFKWGSAFITLNQELLEAYAACKNSTEVVKVQSEIMENQSHG
ncbi:MAG: hypothetical protein BAJATHORv1_120005 [Candidatus Thorarchaeota archaeon]|nr:MAG: hypothetical protein BAJATHORv1_120005 [Candidatus Thorarchaeota archaeon]